MCERNANSQTLNESQHWKLSTASLPHETGLITPKHDVSHEVFLEPQWTDGSILSEFVVILLLINYGLSVSHWQGDYTFPQKC